MALRLRHQTLDWHAARLVGVLNLTPDSFSDGGQVTSIDRAVALGATMVQDGAVLLDVGGESTRPGAVPVSAAEEQRRVIPTIVRLAERFDVSIDTYHAATAIAAVEAGACLVNDVSGGQLDPEMLPTVARLGVPIVLGHLRGTPATMNDQIAFTDVVAEVVKDLDERRAAAERAGIDRSKILLDPGLGFGKRPEHSWALLAALPRLAALGCPLFVGASRKGFVGVVVERPAAERDAATAAITSFVASQVPALIRVHAPGTQRDALLVGNALYAARAGARS